MSLGLAARLRAETARLHREAERSPFMAALLRGRLDRHAYAALLHNLHALYATLEPALAHHDGHPALAWLDRDALARSAALAADLAGLADVRPPSAALASTTTQYLARLRELDRTRPELLIAHAYVRYLGDLSGGQLLRNVVARSAALGPSTGVAFYDFGAAETVARLAAAFRDGLERMPLDDPAPLVEEAAQAFILHRRLFDELASGAGSDAGRPSVIDAARSSS